MEQRHGQLQNLYCPDLMPLNCGFIAEFWQPPISFPVPSSITLPRTSAPVLYAPVLIRQPQCPVVGWRPQHATATLACLAVSSVRSCRSSICPGRLSPAWLVSLVVFSCHVVAKWWHARSIGRLWGGWYALPRIISFFSVLIVYMTIVLSLTQMLVFLSLYVMLSILLSILVSATASLFCACLVSVQVSAPYAIAGSTQELYTCLFRQMARLLLKISRCLAYAAQPAMILRCISLSWFFPLRL